MYRPASHASMIHIKMAFRLPGFLENFRGVWLFPHASQLSASSGLMRAERLAKCHFCRIHDFGRKKTPAMPSSGVVLTNEEAQNANQEIMDVHFPRPTPFGAMAGMILISHDDLITCQPA